jgi:xanthine dehydrogenase YagS FAD-binding subunit
MNRFSYARPATVDEAIREIAAHPTARFIAGGTNLVDLMKYDVERPTRLIDVTKLPGLDQIEPSGAGGLRIGALVKNAAAAIESRIVRDYPLLADAILAGASPQLRNAASMGGNLLQRTRCYYFYDIATPCNKRHPGSGCPAIGGTNRIHAILGASPSCIATHPSDMCVALAALEAVVNVSGPKGDRAIPLAEFHLLPGAQPERETSLAPDEIITSIDLPPSRFAQNYSYLKLRDRASYAFALVSVAAAISFDGDVIGSARLALGGVAHKPWRNQAAEALLAGKRPSAALFREAADLILQEATGHEHNAFKIELTRRAVVRALGQAADGTPQRAAEKNIQ